MVDSTYIAAIELKDKKRNFYLHEALSHWIKNNKTAKMLICTIFVV